MGKIAYLVTDNTGHVEIFEESYGPPSWMVNDPYYKIQRIVYFEVENTNE